MSQANKSAAPVQTTTCPSEAEFFRAHTLLLKEAARDPEECARIMVAYAEAKDDPDAWALIAASMEDYVERGQYPPFAFVKAISEAMRRWRGGESIAVVFGERRGKGLRSRRKDGLLKLAWKRINAALMEHWIAKGFSEDAAAQKVAELRDSSESITQAIAILKELHPLTGHTRFVFPGARSNDRAMSDGAINAAIKRLG